MEVSEKKETKITGFWESLIPVGVAEKPWLTYLEAGKKHPYSPKDIFAQAHCIAAYLMHRGLRSGDRVVILSAASPFVVMTDLALQFIGAVNIILPLNVRKTDVESLYEQYPFKWVFIGDNQVFKEIGEFKSLKKDLEEIILYNDEVDDLSPDKLVTFDRVIPLGKSTWRESQDQMKIRKSLVQPEDLYSIIFERAGNMREIRYKDFKKLANSNSITFNGSEYPVCLFQSNPSLLHSRILGFFVSMQTRMKTILSEKDTPSLPVLVQFQPSCVIITTEELQDLFNQMKEKCSEEGKMKKFELILKLMEKRETALKETSKVPFFLKFRFNTLNRSFLKYLRRMLGGKLKTIICDEGTLPTETARLFEQLGLKIERP